MRQFNALAVALTVVFGVTCGVNETPLGPDKYGPPCKDGERVILGIYNDGGKFHCCGLSSEEQVAVSLKGGLFRALVCPGQALSVQVVLPKGGTIWAEDRDGEVYDLAVPAASSGADYGDFVAVPSSGGTVDLIVP